MPGLAVLSPINESEELSPYRARFGYVRYPGQRSPITPKHSFHNVQDTLASPLPPDTTVDDLWIYDLYGSDDATSPGGFPRSPLTPSHNRSISLPPSTSNYVPPNNIPLIKEPTPHRPAPLNVSPHLARSNTIHEVVEGAGVVDYTDLELPVINTATFSPAEFAEYSPLEQDVFTAWEVMAQLGAAVDHFSGVELFLAQASVAESPPEIDEDVAFWFAEALNMFASDCAEVAADLMKFSEFVEALFLSQEEPVFPPVRTLPRASFSEQDMKEVMESAAQIPELEIVEALAELEASVPPSPIGQRPIRERPPSLILSTSDAVLLQARQQPRSRMQSVGAVGRFSEQETQSKDDLETAKKNRAYVIYGDDTPIEDNWSAKSIVDYGDERFPQHGEDEESMNVARPRPTSGQSTIPRPLSSPVTFGGKSMARARPPSLTLPSPHSPSRSSHYTSSSMSSIFSSLPHSSFSTSPSSPQGSPRQSLTSEKSDKPRFTTSSVKFKKMFTNIFKNNKDKEGPRFSPSLRPFGRRTAGTGSIDATLSALSLSGMSTPASLPPERDPFAATPPPTTASFKKPSPELTPLDGYSSMFNPLKAASKYPTQPLFGGVGLGLEDS